MRRREFLTKTGLGLAASSAVAAALGAARGTSAAPGTTPTGIVGAPSTTALGVTPRPANPASTCPAASPDYIGPLPLVRAQPDRIVAITVCTRPFRAQGPRIETERLGRKTIVHNYGHGGTGWSLSWGSSTLALRHVLATREREIAVIGCGVLGLTSALLAQRAGLKVRIYAKDRPPDVRSTFATGNWSPASRFCTTEGATPEVQDRWEEMARISFRTYQFMLGLPGDPIEWRDGYGFDDEAGASGTSAPRTEPDYPYLERRIQDLGPRSQLLAAGTHPFPGEVAVRYSRLVFNISACMHMLISDFLAAGGVIETREFEKPGDIAKLREKTVVNATGYGARALFGDETVTPVRGQIVRLIPQPEVTYGLSYGRTLYMLPRRDALILQSEAEGDFGSADITPDRAAAERTVQALAELNKIIAANQACALSPRPGV
jgi:glycine/D-amino acid oxidase-like deaminating enzyme